MQVRKKSRPHDRKQGGRHKDILGETLLEIEVMAIIIKGELKEGNLL
jgi:hypothetical protein